MTIFLMMAVRCRFHQKKKKNCRFLRQNHHSISTIKNKISGWSVALVNEIFFIITNIRKRFPRVCPHATVTTIDFHTSITISQYSSYQEFLTPKCCTLVQLVRIFKSYIIIVKKQTIESNQN